MPTNDGTLRVDLNEVARQHANNMNSEFIAAGVLPLMGVNARSGEFNKLPLDNYQKDLGSLDRASGTGYARDTMHYISDVYACSDRGVEDVADQSDVREAARSFNSEIEATKNKTYYVLQAQEIRVAALVFDAGTFSTNAVTTEWSTAATATPFDDVQNAKTTLEDQNEGIVGESQLVLTMSKKVYLNMIKTVDMKGRFPGGNGAESPLFQPPKSVIAEILEVDDILFSAAKFNSVDIWDDEYVSLSLRAPGMGKAMEDGKPAQQTGERPEFGDLQMGRIMFWSLDANGQWIVETYEETARRSDIVRVRQYTDDKILNVNAGTLLSNITA